MKPQDITLAAKAFVQATRGDVVSADVIDKRARICKACPVRTKSLLAGILAKALESAPDELKSYRCGICRCHLGLLVPAKEPHIDSPKERERRIKKNKECWMLKL